jgi:hypothetical protein
MATLLHQVIAAMEGRRNQYNGARTKIYHDAQVAMLFTGEVKAYEPADEEGERLPDERKNIQQYTADLIAEFTNELVEFVDLTATVDLANTEAQADVIVDGDAILTDVPVTTLMYLAKQLEDLRTFVSHLQTPDTAHQWEFDADANCLRAKHPVKRARTKKTTKPLVLHDGNDKHPPQTTTFEEDVKIGEYTTTYFSSGLPAADKKKYLKRIQTLLDAVKMAREKANQAPAPKAAVGQKLVDFVFGD